MVSLVKKIKKMYKGSYFYANKKYGKYTKRRPFPNFNDFDCSPSGDFSMNEVPAEMSDNRTNIGKSNFEKTNSYITSVNDNSCSIVTEGNNVYMTSAGNVTSNISTPANSDIFDNGIQSSSISPVTTISDNTDFTMVNSNEYHSNNLSNPFNNAYEIKPSQNNLMDAVNPFYDTSESSIDIDNSFSNGMNTTGHAKKDFYAKEMKRLSRLNGTGNTSEDEIKMDYNGKNNWKVEIKRYYPSMPQTDEPGDYSNDYSYNGNDRRHSTMPEMGMGMDTKKKSKWWKKMLPKNKRHDSYYSDNTFYDNNINNNNDYEYNPKRYDSERHSTFYTCYDGDDNNTYSSNNNNRYKYSQYNQYDNHLTDDVLVVNQNAKTNSVYF